MCRRYSSLLEPKSHLSTRPLLLRMRVFSSGFVGLWSYVRSTATMPVLVSRPITPRESPTQAVVSVRPCDVPAHATTWLPISACFYPLFLHKSFKLTDSEYDLSNHNFSEKLLSTNFKHETVPKRPQPDPYEPEKVCPKDSEFHQIERSLGTICQLPGDSHATKVWGS